MAIAHLQSGEVAALVNGQGQPPSPQTVALFKGRDLEVMRVVLPAGKQVPPHSVSGELTAQCLQGRIEFTHGDQVSVLLADQFLHLAPGVEHALRALEDSAVLVTLALRKEPGVQRNR